MAVRRPDPTSAEVLMLVLAVVFCIIVGAVIVLVFRAGGVELL